MGVYSDFTFLTADDDVTARSAEVPLADWAGGLNNGGSNAPGIGINVGNAGPIPIADVPEQFTVLDQNELPRTPQNSAVISNSGFVDFAATYPASGGVEGPGIVPIRVGVADDDGLGLIDTDLGEANLPDDTGWIAGAAPPPPEPPANTVAPALSGVPTVGVPLTVSDGTWTGNPVPTFEYEFFVDGISVQGPGPSNEYTPQPADDGLPLFANVIATNSEGTDTAQSDTQNVVT